MLGLGLFTMYRIIGWTFISGIVIVILTGFINYTIGKMYNKLQIA